MYKFKYNTFALTAVSTQHHYLDSYGLYFVADWLKLAEYTGQTILKEKAKAV